MCVSVPREVLRVWKDRAEVRLAGGVRTVVTVALPDLAPGDYVLLHADAAVERLTPAEAQETLALFEEIAALFDDTAAVDTLLASAAGGVEHDQ